MKRRRGMASFLLRPEITIKRLPGGVVHVSIEAAGHDFMRAARHFNKMINRICYGLAAARNGATGQLHDTLYSMNSWALRVLTIWLPAMLATFLCGLGVIIAYRKYVGANIW